VVKLSALHTGRLKKNSQLMLYRGISVLFLRHIKKIAKSDC